MFWIELLIVLAIIFVGVRLSGPFLAFAGGIGMLIMTFGLHVKPSDPPVTVILIIIPRYHYCKLYTCIFTCITKVLQKAIF